MLELIIGKELMRLLEFYENKRKIKRTKTENSLNLGEIETFIKVAHYFLQGSVLRYHSYKVTNEKTQNDFFI